MKQIQLTQGQVSVVDDEDYEALSRYRWQARLLPKYSRYYALRNERVGGTTRPIYMHAVVAGTTDGQITHHRNGNSLDNTRNNLITMDQAVHARFHAVPRAPGSEEVFMKNAGESFRVTVGISFPSKVWARMNAMADEEYGGNRSALVAHVMEAWLAGQEQIPITIVEELAADE